MAKGGRRKVGEAYVELRADSTKLGPDLEKMRRETEKTAKQVEGDTRKIGDGFKRTGEQIEKNTEGFRKFAGAISSTVGIWTATVGAVTIVIGLVAKLTGRMKTYGETARESIKETNELLSRQRELFEAIEAASRKALANIVAVKGAEIDDRYESLITKIGGRERYEAIKEADRLGISETQRSPALQAALDELQRLESRRRALNAAAQRRQAEVQRQEAEAEASQRPSSTGNLQSPTPLDPGGVIRGSLGTLADIREILGSMARMESRLERIDRNTHSASQP